VLASIPPVDGPILVEALFTSGPPRLDLDRLEERLARQFGRVGHVAQGDTIQGAAIFALEDLPARRLGDRRLPCTILFLPRLDLTDRGALADSVRQTWDWTLVKEAVARATAAHLVMPMFSWSWLDRGIRIELMHAAVEAVLEQSAPSALHWPKSQCVVSPETYRRARIGPDDPLYPAVNVRMFDGSGERPDEIVMDTLGLAPLGLPDFQVRCTGLEAAEVARQLSNLALYIFEHGDVIEDGHTVAGARAGGVWRCSRAASWAEPARGVIQLDVSAGNPDRGVRRRWSR